MPFVPVALLRAAALLAGFGSMYFAITTMTQTEYRHEFFEPVIADVERTLTVRAVYLGLRPESAQSGVELPGRPMRSTTAGSVTTARMDSRLNGRAARLDGDHPGVGIERHDLEGLLVRPRRSAPLAQSPWHRVHDTNCAGPRICRRSATGRPRR